MLFRKRRKPEDSRATGGGSGGDLPKPATYEITFDMMEKGAKVLRHGRTVRQIAVMVGTNVCLVTSGDTVDRPTYEALLAGGIISPPQRMIPGLDGDHPAETD